MSGGLRIRLAGSAKLAQQLQKAGAIAQQAAGAAAYNVGLAVLRRAVRNAPKKWGVLRGSGYVTRPDAQGRVTVGFGGPAKAYAWIQHERLDFHHSEGGPKYLSRAVEEVKPLQGQLFATVFKAALERGYVPPSGGAPDNPNAGPTHQQAKHAKALGRLKSYVKGKAAGKATQKATKAGKAKPKHAGKATKAGKAPKK